MHEKSYCGAASIATSGGASMAASMWITGASGFELPPPPHAAANDPRDTNRTARRFPMGVFVHRITGCSPRRSLRLGSRRLAQAEVEPRQPFAISCLVALSKGVVPVGVFFILVGCTTHNPRNCDDGVCSDP